MQKGFPCIDPSHEKTNVVIGMQLNKGKKNATLLKREVTLRSNGKRELKNEA